MKFEHFILLELKAFLSYQRLDYSLHYWRSTSQFEVDCIIGRELALEIKPTSQVHEKHLKGLKALREEGLIKNFAVISQDPEIRILDGIWIYPWEVFLKKIKKNMEGKNQAHPFSLEA